MRDHLNRQTGYAAAAMAATMLALDLGWLGIVAREFYDAQLGSLKSPDISPAVAGTFYLFYLAVTYWHAVRGAADLGDAGRRGAGLGLAAYGTYELTNWAVVRNWPAALVPVDLVWGIVLTAAVALVGFRVRGASGSSR